MALGRQKKHNKRRLLYNLSVGVSIKHLVIMDLRLKILYQAVAEAEKSLGHL
jgi:hypothetical protein